MPSLGLEKRYCSYGYYNNGYCRNSGGLAYGARVGIGIAIAVAVLLIVALLGFAARRRRQNAINSMRPAFQTNQTYQQQSYQPGAYVPQTGYGYPNNQQQYYNSAGTPAGGQPGSGATSYPPPSGAPPEDQPEMVDGRPYAPPSQPPPTYQK
ncbi:unnamed protein product [Parajaminaea phylloscopi]